MAGKIHVGIGGWDYDPWRGAFYPPGLAKTKQLAFASRALTAIEINATFYKLQTPELYERWAATVPDGFVFALKASRFCTNRKILAEGGEAVGRFCGQGFTRLGDKLGPILWQLADTKKFDPDDVARFLDLLPREADGMKLRHAIEARNESFADPRFVDIARNAGVAICVDERPGTAMIADATADFAYARLLNAREEEPTGYTPAELDGWTEIAKNWAQGDDDRLAKTAAVIPATSRDVFMFFINGAKVRAPTAATGVIQRLGGGTFS